MPRKFKPMKSSQLPKPRKFKPSKLTTLCCTIHNTSHEVLSVAQVVVCYSKYPKISNTLKSHTSLCMLQIIYSGCSIIFVVEYILCNVVATKHTCTCLPLSVCIQKFLLLIFQYCCVCVGTQDDQRMSKIMQLAHEFLQKFCYKNETNQNLLHRHLDLFLLSGDNVCDNHVTLRRAFHQNLSQFELRDLKIFQCLNVMVFKPHLLVLLRGLKNNSNSFKEPAKQTFTIRFCHLTTFSPAASRG